MRVDVLHGQSIGDWQILTKELHAKQWVRPHCMVIVLGDSISQPLVLSFALWLMVQYFP